MTDERDPMRHVRAWAERTRAEWDAGIDRTAPDDAADHPGTDPGDGRTQCETCGKYVWPFLHSCKGVRVYPPDVGTPEHPPA